MGSQGVRGPAYRLVYGNTKEILSLRNQIWISPMGLSHDILPRILPHICSWTKQYGMNFLTWYGSRAQLVITQPELIKEILSNSDGTYPKVQAPGFLRKILGDGLVTAGGYDPSDGCKCGDYVKKMETQRGQGDRGIPRLYAFNIGNYFQNSFWKDFVKTSDDVEADKLEQGIRDSIIKMMKTREEKAMKGESEGYGNDYFGLLLKAYHDPDMTKRISLDVLIDECKTFYIAGHETTTKLLTWTILLLATHTDWQEKLREEVLELFGQQNPTPDGIGKLKTMSMVINESLRLYPPAVNISRNVEREVRLGKYILPANMELVIPILAIHHDPQIWGEDVDLFKPERFAEGVAKASNNTPAAFLPFSSGPRICVGLNFAATEAKIALSMILQRYRFNLSPSYVHSPVLVVTLRPQHGLQVIFQPLSVNQRN
ncbi:cytochrome P450 734A1 [Citrus sinensis]|nr:cytochrome P450 734A1 [Citrus sinensis]